MTRPKVHPRKLAGSLMSLVLLNAALAGEDSALLVANQTIFDNGRERSLGRQDAGSIPQGKYISYLDFLRDSLEGLNVDYRDPANYPVVVLIDDGVDFDEGSGNSYNGCDVLGSTFVNSPEFPTSLNVAAPSVPDFYVFGKKETSQAPGQSRFAFVFRYDFRGTDQPDFTTPTPPAPPEPPQLDSGDYLQIDRESNRLGTTGQVFHGQGVASVLTGYAGDHDNGAPPVNYSVVTGHFYGMGASPFGRFACAKLDTVLPPSEQIFCPPAGWRPELAFAVDDLKLLAGEIHRELQRLSSSTNMRTAITNNSFAIGYYLPYLDPGAAADNFPPSEVDHFSFGGAYHIKYDRYCSTYDALTRDTRYREPATSEVVLSAPTLFVAAAGNDGCFYQRNLPVSTYNQYQDGAEAIDFYDLQQDRVSSSPTFGEFISSYPPRPFMESVWTPGLAKNALTVGACSASDQERNHFSFDYVDWLNCVQPPSDDPARKKDRSRVLKGIYSSIGSARSGQDVTSYSSKGRSFLDASHSEDPYWKPNRIRIKPDVVAPADGVSFNAGYNPESLLAETVFFNTSLDPKIEFESLLSPIISVRRLSASASSCPPQPEANAVLHVDAPNFRHHIAPQVGGTSHATPHVTGMVQVCSFFIQNYYGKDFPFLVSSPGPSPALLKAYVIHTAKVLTGAHTGPYKLDRTNDNNSGRNFVENYDYDDGGTPDDPYDDPPPHRANSKSLSGVRQGQLGNGAGESPALLGGPAVPTQ